MVLSIAHTALFLVRLFPSFSSLSVLISPQGPKFVIGICPSWVSILWMRDDAGIIYSAIDYTVSPILLETDANLSLSRPSLDVRNLDDRAP